MTANIGAYLCRKLNLKHLAHDTFKGNAPEQTRLHNGQQRRQDICIIKSKSKKLKKDDPYIPTDS